MSSERGYIMFLPATLAIVLALLPVGGALAAPAAQAAGPVTLEVVLTNDGCTSTPPTVGAGAVTFHVRNVGGDRVSEVEVVRGDLIVGEKENLAPCDVNHWTDTGMERNQAPGQMSRS